MTIKARIIYCTSRSEEMAVVEAEPVGQNEQESAAFEEARRALVEEEEEFGNDLVNAHKMDNEKLVNV